MRLTLFVLALLCASPALAHSLPGEQLSRLTLLTAEPQQSPVGVGVSLAPKYLDVTAPAIITGVGGAGVIAGGFFFLFGSVLRNIAFFFVGIGTFIVAGLPLLIGLPWLIVVAVKNGNLAREQAVRESSLVTVVSF